MSVGASIFLLAVGAILKFAVTVENPEGFGSQRDRRDP